MHSFLERGGQVVGKESLLERNLLVAAYFALFFFFPQLPDGIFKNTPRLLLGSKNVTSTGCLLMVLMEA